MQRQAGVSGGGEHGGEGQGTTEKEAPRLQELLLTAAPPLARR